MTNCWPFNEHLVVATELMAKVGISFEFRSPSTSNECIGQPKDERQALNLSPLLKIFLHIVVSALNSRILSFCNFSIVFIE